ncbi:transketolase C-terminal domain-containing protein [Fulvivirgaceae bacterium BMA12]|uniref:3-methyl-2-oxobutanoate dehydrogenase (2-methylpropanoyl-transferring) n=1 Tax=Agaribacillus aureus TaxID=3051825 RepID=A0ABT8LA46_9BACT|nr:transketolase C-terminal domain-containing protein [Fulvivirgaceae bacterium BMA12]
MSTIVAKNRSQISRRILTKAYRLMFTVETMTSICEDNKEISGKYIHGAYHGQEAILLAVGLQLEPHDFGSFHDGDVATMLALGITPHELMLQILGKAGDPFSGGRAYYCYPSLKRAEFPTVPCQSRLTGMRTIQGTGMAHAIAYMEQQKLRKTDKTSIVICSMGDEMKDNMIAEAWHVAISRKLPIIYLALNNHHVSPDLNERLGAMDAYEYAGRFKGMKRMKVDGSDFVSAYEGIKKAMAAVRKDMGPLLIQAKCPSFSYVDSTGNTQHIGDRNLKSHNRSASLFRLRDHLLAIGAPESSIMEIESAVKDYVQKAFQQALNMAEPDLGTARLHEFVETPVKEGQGKKRRRASSKVTMAQAASSAINEILGKHPEALFYYQDVREESDGAAEKAEMKKRFGKHRVLGMPELDAYMIGSTTGMSAVGAKPIVEVQSGGGHQNHLSRWVEEIGSSCYLSMGQFPVQALIRVPVGNYEDEKSYSFGHLDSALLNIKGVKVVYPSNAADMKGLMKAAFYDPNPVVILENKGLYKAKTTEINGSMSFEPDDGYMIPLGLSNKILEAEKKKTQEGNSVLIITYGMGVHWAKAACQPMGGQVTILDLRTLSPLDWETIKKEVKIHSKVLILTEEPLLNSFGESLAGRIAGECFQFLDAPIQIVGAESLPAIVMNVNLKSVMLPSSDRVGEALSELLAY